MDTLKVIATSEEGTRAALLEARHLSQRLNVSRTVLMVLRLRSSSAPTDGALEDAATVEDLQQMAGETGLNISVRLCACSKYSEAFQWMLPPRSVVVVGGRRRWWWPTREQRIADQLKSAGHAIVFADASWSGDRHAMLEAPYFDR